MQDIKEQILAAVEEDDIKFIRLQFTDIFGQMKNIAITDKQLTKALDNRYMFDGSSIHGFGRVEESDMYLAPDLDTFVVFPWRPQNGKVARFICNILTADHQIYDSCPRYILKKALDEAKKMGYTFNVGPECEFFLFHSDENGVPTTVTHDNAGYFDVAPVDLGENARRDMCLVLEEMGYEIEASHHEDAKGQHEIDFKYADALTTADRIMTFKMVVKVIAQKHGLYASFMPKPFPDDSGSGLHINMSLSKDGVNLFNDPSGKFGLSKTAYSFMAGVMENIDGFTALLNPVVNSYKRLSPGYEAPTHIAWSFQNRSPLFRIPAATGEDARIELRSPDPMCNPYLAFAVILTAGLDGIKRGLTPPPHITGNLFNMTEAERAKLGIKSLPRDLFDAIEKMKENQLVRSVLGDQIMDKYIEAKLSEWREYSKTVSDWEIKRYL